MEKEDSEPPGSRAQAPAECQLSSYYRQTHQQLFAITSPIFRMAGDSPLCCAAWESRAELPLARQACSTVPRQHPSVRREQHHLSTATGALEIPGLEQPVGD